MKTLVATSVAAIVIVAASGLVVGCGNSANKTEIKSPAKPAAQTKAQTECPVMGGKINKEQFTDVKGKRIYVCCKGCIGKIEADPDKYIKQMELEGVTLAAPPKSDAHDSKTGDHTGHNH